jgi:hypothetical protein
MPNIRVGYGSDFVVKDQKVGIGSEDPRATLDVRGTIKGDFNIAGVSTLTSYSGFAAQKQNVTKESTTGISTVGVGTFVQSYETETGNLELVGQFNTVSEDIIVDEGKIFEITTTNITGITTLGTQEVYAPDPSVVSVGTLESVSIQSHFSVPDGGISERVDNPIEGSVRFNDDLNTLEFYNGVEWRQFVVDGASGRGVFGGGAPGPVGNANSVIDFLQIHSQGNAVNFGTLTSERNNIASCSSNIRGVWGGGSASSYVNTIDYVTIASQGNAISFGTLSTVNRAYLSACSSSTRGLFGGGYTTSPANATVNVIDYIQFSTLGNAVDFGDLFTGRYSTSSFSSPTRAIWAGGAPSANTLNIIDYVTIASTGNAVKFGELTTKRWGQAGCSNSVRGISAGGGINTPTFTNIMDYVTIASLGNAIYFGDLTEVKNRPGGCSSQIRGVFGGNSPTGNVIEYVTIASTGNAQDFGDLTVGRFALAACSDSHGGLGGF